MRFEFSTVVDGTHCHIRATENRLIPGKKVDDRPHKHYFMEFHWICAGTETIYLPQENRHIRLQPGQILLLPGGVYHVHCLSKEVNEKQRKFGTKGRHLLNNKLKCQFSTTITLFISDNKT